MSDAMSAEAWEAVWGVIRGCWPGSALDQAVVKTEWRAAFAKCDPEVLVQAVRACASHDDRPPNLARLSVWYTDLMKHQNARLPTTMVPDPPPTADAWESQYQANLVATQRQMAHETACPRCTAYAQDRTGSPCPIGAAYWEPWYQHGMVRP